MNTATLSGSHAGREFALEVSGETWDRFRDWRVRLQATVGELLAEVTQSRPDPESALTEPELNSYLDSLDSLISSCAGEETSPVAPSTA